MIKYVKCLRRHPDLAPQDFRRHWEEYKALWQALANHFGAERVSFSTTLAVDANDRILIERGTEDPFDGMVETWVVDAKDIEDGFSKPAAQPLLQQVYAKEHEFLDLGRCCFFFSADD